MEIRDRVKKIREELGLSQTEFGNRISLERSAISLIERKQRNITERTIKDICREFNIDYRWLTTGEGEMFSSIDDEVMAMIDKILSNESEEARSAFKKLAQMEPEDWKFVDDVITALIENRKNRKK